MSQIVQKFRCLSHISLPDGIYDTSDPEMIVHNDLSSHFSTAPCIRSHPNLSRSVLGGGRATLIFSLRFHLKHRRTQLSPNKLSHKTILEI